MAPEVTNSMGWSDMTMFLVGVVIGFLGAVGLMTIYIVHRCK